jgi:ketosteroid isomerase-like protein
MTRSTQEVFDSHREAIETGNFEQLIADYAEDAVLVTLDGSFIGREAILTGFFQAMFSQAPDAKINFEKVAVERDVCLLQWSVDASNLTVPRGTAVFIIQDGLIQRQGEWFEIVPKEG